MENRFAVGSMESARSLIWKLWINKSDVYLVARDTGASMRVSFHGSGKCHIKTMSSFARSVQSVRGVPEPYLDKWNIAHSARGNVMPAFQIFVPSSQLRDRPYCENKRVTWISAPGQGYTAWISVVFEKADAESHIGEADVMFRHQLPNSKIVSLICLYYRDTDAIQKIVAQMQELARTQTPHLVTKNADHNDPRKCALLIGGVEPRNGSRYVIEIAGDTIFRGDEPWNAQ